MPLFWGIKWNLSSILPDAVGCGYSWHEEERTGSVVRWVHHLAWAMLVLLGLNPVSLGMSVMSYWPVPLALVSILCLLGKFIFLCRWIHGYFWGQAYFWELERPVTENLSFPPHVIWPKYHLEQWPAAWESLSVLLKIQIYWTLLYWHSSSVALNLLECAVFVYSPPSIKVTFDCSKININKY